MRTFILLPAVTLAAFAVAQQPSKVTYQTPGARAAVVLPELGKAAGLKLVANPQVEDEVLILNVKDMDARALMDRLARVTGGVWEEKGDTFYLGRPFDVTTAQEREERALRRDRIAQQVARHVEEIRKQPAFDAKQAEQLANLNPQNINPQTFRDLPKPPAERVIAELLARMDPAQLVLDEGQRAVFATPTTTRMQRSLPSGSANLLREFLRQVQMFAEATRRNTPAPTPSGETQSFVIGGLTPEVGPGDFRAGLGKAVLSVRAIPGGSLLVSLTVVDRNGLLLSRGQASINPSSPTPPSSATRAGGIELSPLAREFGVLTAVAGATGSMVMVAVGRDTGARGQNNLTTFDMVGQPTARPVVSPELRARLRAPQTYDPTATTVGEALVTASEKLSVPLVAAFPDSAVVPLMRQLVAGIPASELEGTLDRRDDLIAKRVDGTLEIQPELRHTARKRRVNRVALGTAIRQLVEKSALALRDMGAYAVRQEKPLSLNDLDGLLLANADPSIGQDDLSSFTQGNWNTLRLLGSLPPAQLNRLANENPISFQELNATQRSYIADEYYNQDSANGTFFMGGVNIRQSVGGPNEAPRPPLLDEPTEVLPQGLPLNGLLRLSIQTEDAVRARDSQKAVTRFLSVGSLALTNMLSRDSGGGIQIADFSPPTFDKFQAATQSQYNFRFELAPEVSFGRMLRDSSVVPGSVMGSWEQLPTRLREAYGQAAARMNRRG